MLYLDIYILNAAGSLLDTALLAALTTLLLLYLPLFPSPPFPQLAKLCGCCT
jgi:exosome complex RNA-binding protein Rrp42 (RNase PH superfamily)